MAKVYRDGTPLIEIIKDGWARGFEVAQTLDEAAEMGYNTNRKEVLIEWRKMDDEFDEYCKKQFLTKEGKGND